MKIWHKVVLAIFVTFTLWGVAVKFLGFGDSVSWQEEVLLHDGRKIVVKRTVDRGGSHEIGQRPPIGEQSLLFSLPSLQQRVSWKVGSTKDIGSADLSPIMLDIVDDIPFLVTQTVGCLSYNKWGRPNPPYIIFRYSNETWQQVELKKLPLALKIPNMIISSPDVMAQRTGMKVVSADKISELNSSLNQPEYKTILRKQMPNQGVNCGKMISDGHNGWIGIGWFTNQPSYEKCVKICEQNKMSSEYCPCKKIFNKN